MNLAADLPSIFDPQSRAATAVVELAWVLLTGGALLFVAVMVLIGLALWKRPAWLADRRTIVAGGIALPALTTLALMIYSLGLVASADDGATPEFAIEVTGHQWWWRVRYLDAGGAVDFETANEIRLPVGRTVELRLVSADVLHSFWVPQLGGKLDLIPGRVNRMRVAAERAGVFRGQCAEYCGGPHAQMALYVVAEPDERFAQWRERQRAPATITLPLFVERCGACHVVRGTEARGTPGPDLTHVGGRVSLGAGVLANEPRALSNWIVAGQHLKPGNLMPAFADLAPADLAAITGYVAALR